MQRKTCQCGLCGWVEKKHKDTKAQSHKERPRLITFDCGLSLWLCAFVSLCFFSHRIQVFHRLPGKFRSGTARRRFGSAFTSRPAVSPRINFAVPAAAIIAALSVVRIGFG